MNLKTNARGQGSLEVLIISTAVVIMAFLFTSIFLTAQDSTTALLLAKNKCTEAFNQLENGIGSP